MSCSISDGRWSMNNRENWATHWQTVTTPDTLPSWIQWFLSKAWERLYECWNPVCFNLFCFFLDLAPLPILSHMVCSPPDVLQIFILSLVLILLISGLSACVVYSFSGNLLNQLWMRRQHWREGKWTSSAGGKVCNRGSSLLLALQWVRLFILPSTSIYLVCTVVPLIHEFTFFGFIYLLLTTFQKY